MVSQWRKIREFFVEWKAEREQVERVTNNWVVIVILASTVRIIVYIICHLASQLGKTYP